MGSYYDLVKNKATYSYSITPIQVKLFLLIATIFGFCFVFTSPPMKSPDEPQHYYRSFEVSELHFLSTKYSDGRFGYNLPHNVGVFGEKHLAIEEKHLPPDVSLLKQLYKQGYTQERREIRFENSAVYSPVGYTSSALGLSTAKALHLSILKGFYIGRIFNLLTYILLVALALWIAPAFRWIMLSVSLLPMSLFQAASFSPDAITNGLTCLAFGLFLYLYNLRTIHTKHLLSSLVVLMALALTKQVYILLLVPYLFIAKDKFKHNTHYFVWCLAIIIVPVISSMIWLFFSADIADKLKVMFKLGDSISAIDQIRYVVTNPLDYAWTIIRTLFGQSDYLLKGTFGLLGWATISLPLITYICISLILLISILAEGSERRLFMSAKIKVALSVTAIITLIGVCSSLYFSFTPVGSSTINGLQGRYFIPVLLLILPVVVSKRFTLKSRQKDLIVIYVIFTCFILLSSLVVLAKATYI